MDEMTIFQKTVRKIQLWIVWLVYINSVVNSEYYCEFSNFKMLSDAGGAGARRRRLCQSPLVTTTSLIHFCPVSLMASFNFAALDLDLLSTLPVEISVVSYCWSEFTRVELFSGDSWIIVSDKVVMSA